jgi:hypothetical protein
VHNAAKTRLTEAARRAQLRRRPVHIGHARLLEARMRQIHAGHARDCAVVPHGGASSASAPQGGAVGAGRVVPPRCLLRRPHGLRPQVHQTAVQARPRRCPQPHGGAAPLRVPRRVRRSSEVQDVPRTRLGTATTCARRSTGARAAAASSTVTMCRTRRFALAPTLLTAPAATRTTTTSAIVCRGSLKV